METKVFVNAKNKSKKDGQNLLQRLFIGFRMTAAFNTRNFPKSFHVIIEVQVCINTYLTIDLRSIVNAHRNDSLRFKNIDDPSTSEYIHTNSHSTNKLAKRLRSTLNCHNKSPLQMQYEKSQATVHTSRHRLYLSIFCFRFLRRYDFKFFLFFFFNGENHFSFENN